MRIRSSASLAPRVALVVFAVACGGGAKAPPAAAPPVAATPASTAAPAINGIPSWMAVDSTAKTARIDLTAGMTPDNNHWNYNGYTNGKLTISVPKGYRVTINFHNADQTLAHSVAVIKPIDPLPPSFDNPTPAFPGSLSPNPTDPGKANQPGGNQTIAFTASTTGDYLLICTIPAHAVTGMWMHFKVTDTGTPSVQSTS